MIRIVIAADEERARRVRIVKIVIVFGSVLHVCATITNREGAIVAVVVVAVDASPAASRGNTVVNGASAKHSPHPFFSRTAAAIPPLSTIVAAPASVRDQSHRGRCY